MRRALLSRLRALDGSHEVLGRPLTAEQLRLAFQVLLRYDGTANPERDNAPTRRVTAMRHLGFVYSVETWRKEPERQLVAILAEHLERPPMAA